MAFFIVAALLFGTDYVVKRYIDRSYSIGQPHKILNGHVMIEKFYNKGAALGFLKERPDQLKKTQRISVAFICILFSVLAARGKRSERMMTSGMALMAAGGLNNLYDRETKGHVVDYFWFPQKTKKKRKIIFNLSDFFVFLGAILSTIGYLKD